MRTICHVLLVAAALSGCGGERREGPDFFFGFSEDALKLEGAAAAEPARGLGAGGFRITLNWEPGRLALSAADAAGIERALAAGEGLRVIVAIYADSAGEAPVDDVDREQYCGYARDLVARFSDVKDVVIWNEPNVSRFWRPQFGREGESAAPAAYGALLARCWDALHAVRPNVNVIAPATAPRGNDNPSAVSNVSHSPGAFIRKLGEAYRASGRARPLFDIVGHHVYGDTYAEPPSRRHVGSKTIAQGDWNKLMASLEAAFSATPQPIPGECPDARCVSIVYLEGGFQTSADPAKASLYEAPSESGTIPDRAARGPDQATQIRDAVRLAYCQPYVTAFLNFLLWDEPTAAGWQSGAYWADRTAKGSLPAFREVVREVNDEEVDCDALPGGRPSADYTPPQAIADLRATRGGRLTWSASSDPSGIEGYRVFRNGRDYAWSAGPRFSGAAPGERTYAYTVFAQDTAGNLSPASNAVTVSATDGR